MNVLLNKKIFTGKLLATDKLKIKINKKTDIIFFINWQNKQLVLSKSRYVKNVIFNTKSENGILLKCFPIVSLNDDYVILYWDNKKIEL